MPSLMGRYYQIAALSIIVGISQETKNFLMVKKVMPPV